MAGTKKRSAAVTGAGSGLGRDISLGLAAKDYHVFGTALSPEEIADVRHASGGAVTLSRCDITDEVAVAGWAREVRAKTDGGLNLLISNAGILTPGPLEVLPLSAIRREFDVNVFGALAVVNAFLPALREARGRIVQVSTWTASLPLPFNGPSGASKAAFDAFAAVYRAELKSFGIDVVLAVAGNMKTGGPGKTSRRSQADRRGYDRRATRVVRKKLRRFCSHSQHNAGQRAGIGLRGQARYRTGRTNARSEPGRGRGQTPKTFSGSFTRNRMPNRMRCAFGWSACNSKQILTTKGITHDRDNGH